MQGNGQNCLKQNKSKCKVEGQIKNQNVQGGNQNDFEPGRHFVQRALSRFVREGKAVFTRFYHKVTFRPPPTRQGLPDDYKN